MSLPDEHRSEIITNGLHFMRAITEAYGADEGMRLWDTIASTLDPDIKGQIFFAMLVGTHNDTIVLKPAKANGLSDKIAAIKEIRTWTGYGLKEAKDTADMVNGGRSVTLKVNPAEHAQAIRGLRRVGFQV